MDLSCGECNVISLYVLSMNLFVLCVAGLSVCEWFGDTIRNTFGCGFILLLNVLELFGVVGDDLLHRVCMVFQRVCVVPVIPVWV